MTSCSQRTPGPASQIAAEIDARLVKHAAHLGEDLVEGFAPARPSRRRHARCDEQGLGMPQPMTSVRG
jgi:hypothetical protein